MRSIVGMIAAIPLALPIAASAASLTQSGTTNGLSWTAESLIVGQTSTATAAGGGNPIYFANQPKYQGVVTLIMNEGAAGNFICSGSLLSDHISILTAGHCVSNGTNARPISTTAYFGANTNPDSNVYSDPTSTVIAIKSISVNPKYTGSVIDANDIAVLRLSAPAPTSFTSYDLYTGSDLSGLGYNIAGYGARSDTGGSVGANLNPGRLRQGDNTYDFRLGDPIFNGFFTNINPATGKNFFGSTADISNSYLADFDNGLQANNASCLITTAITGTMDGRFCGPKSLGVGATEVSSAGGDSGGPQFVEGKIASVTSYGLSFGMSFGDIDAKLNSSFGEFNGFVPVSSNLDFINSAIPEPSAWALMIAGFGIVGTSARRARRRQTITA